jgi:phage shock protein A
MKAQWKNAQIQNSIAKALEGLTFENQFESSFGAAAEKIKNAQSEAAARNEMMGNSMTGKAWEMESRAQDAEAEVELQKLEARLGMGAAPTTVDAPTAQLQVGLNGAAPSGGAAPAEVTKSEAEKQLEELEKRMKGE